MSVTVHQILNDAKRLVNRLREHDTTANNIMIQTQAVYKSVESMKEYCEDLVDQQMANQMRAPRSVFVFNVQQENKHIRELQQENQELRAHLEEHQSVLRLIMSKYRHHMTNMVKKTPTLTEDENNSVSQELQEKANSICKMAEIMRKSVEMDENGYVEERKTLTQLLTENKGLRELLEISRSSGSLYYPMYSFETADKEVQTDT